ncbi:MAG: hypothetical protein QXS54_09075 [Candidatus Methanomethylicaceae archaeon]
MDYIEFESLNRRFYGKIGVFYIARNYEIVDNPGGNFLPVYLGNYTKPMDVEFEVFGNDFPTYSADIYQCRIYLQAQDYEFTARVYNIRINSRESVYLYKSPNETVLPPGEYKLIKGTFTAYFISTMSG